MVRDGIGFDGIEGFRKVGWVEDENEGFDAEFRGWVEDENEEFDAEFRSTGRFVLPVAILVVSDGCGGGGAGI